MTDVAVIAIFAVLFFSSLYGYGCLAARICRGARPVFFTICLGLAVVVLIGGVLNLLGLAVGAVLDGVMVFGWILCLRPLLRRLKAGCLGTWRQMRIPDGYPLALALSGMIILAVFVFYADTVARPEAFNLHDDLEKYLNHPLRMLATGTLRGSPFSSLGAETMGGQAFLQGFAAVHWPMGYVNTIDAVFAFVLCLMMILSAGLRLKLSPGIIPLLLLAAVVINPQYVNISSIYTTSALALFLFLDPWMAIWGKAPAEASGPPPAACLGLVYAALLALKTTNLMLVAVHFALLAGGSAFASRDFKKTGAWAAGVIGLALAFSLPWVLLYAADWAGGLSAVAHFQDRAPEGACDRLFLEAIRLFSLKPLFYGSGSALGHYTWTMIIAMACALFSGGCGRWRRPGSRIGTGLAVAAGAAAPILYGITMILVAPRLVGPDHGLRYLCPVIIAAFPATLMIALSTVLTPACRKKEAGPFLKRTGQAGMVFTLVVIAFFAGPFVQRIRAIARYGTALAFEQARTPDYILYSRYMLSEDAEKQVRKAQATVPENKKIAVWSQLASHLDYRRNPIVDIDPAGLANPWLRFPFDGTSRDGIRYFIDSGIRHVMWQYNAYAIRSAQNLFAVRSARNLTDWAASSYPRSHRIGVRTHRFASMLLKIIDASQVVFNDGSTVVVRLVPRPS